MKDTPAAGATAAFALEGNYAADVKDSDVIVQHIIGTSDGLPNGIVAHFPQMFRQEGTN